MHSAESTQSFSVAIYGNMPVRLGAGGGKGGRSRLLGSVLPPGSAVDGVVGAPLYALWDVMHELMCDSRRVSKLGRVRGGSSLWQTGHSSSSGIRFGGCVGCDSSDRWCGSGGNRRLLDLDGPATVEADAPMVWLYIDR